MKIAIILPRRFLFAVNQPNSIETVVRTFANHSSPEHSITVFCDEGADDHGAIRTVTVPSNLSRKARSKLIAKRIREYAPDIIEVHQHVLGAQQIARRVLDIPCILYRHNSTKRPKNWFRKQVSIRRYHACSAVIFVSDFLNQEFRGIFPKLGDKAYTVSNTIEPEPWIGDIASKEKLIAFGGRAAPEKGFAEACAALAAMLEKYPDWNAEMCALDWEKHKNFAEQHIRQLESFGSRFTLNRDQPLTTVRKMLKRAAISLIPSVFEEPFGLAALEAHVAGAAVVSSGRGGLREASGPHAHYIDEVTSNALSTALDHLIQNSTERIKLAENGQKYVLETHTAQQGIKKLEDVRQEIVTRFKATSQSK